MDTARKVYVAVQAAFDADGRVIPLSIEWEDGRRYQIDRVLDIRRAASLKAGGSGIRYAVRIGNRQSYIWREDDRWFVEGKT